MQKRFPHIWKYHPLDIAYSNEIWKFDNFLTSWISERRPRRKFSFHPLHNVNRALSKYTLALFAVQPEVKSASRFQFLIIYFIKWIRCCSKRFSRLVFLVCNLDSKASEFFMLTLGAFSRCFPKVTSSCSFLESSIDGDLGFPLAMQTDPFVLNIRMFHLRI